MSNLYRGPSIDASYQVSVHLAKQIFRNRPIRNKNCLWWPYLLMDRDEMSKVYRCFLPSFGSFCLTVSEEKNFKNKRRFFQKSTNQKQESSVVAMFVNGSGRNEQYLQRTFHRCFLPRFGSFGKVVSEEKIFRNQPIRNKNCLWWPCLLMDRNEMSNL